MTDAKLAPNLPDWMVEHANRYLSSGGTDGHIYKMTQPGRPEITVPSLLLTTTGRKSGEKFIFPLFYGEVGGSYFVIASTVIIVPTAAVVLGAGSLEDLGVLGFPDFVEAWAGPGVAAAVSAGVALAILNAVIVMVLQNARVLYASARDQAWPEPVNRAMTKLHPRWKSPWAATLVAGLVLGFGLGEAQQILDHSHRRTDQPADVAHLLLLLWRQLAGQSLLQHLRVGAGGAQRVLEIVRHTPDEAGPRLAAQAPGAAADLLHGVVVGELDVGLDELPHPCGAPVDRVIERATGSHSMAAWRRNQVIWRRANCHVRVFTSAIVSATSFIESFRRVPICSVTSGASWLLMMIKLMFNAARVCPTRSCSSRASARRSALV